MKTTKKIMLTGMACCFCVSELFAGGLLTNTNQSVHFLRNPARNASTEIDAVYTNPAGLAKLSEEGWHFSLNNQSAFQTRTITSTFGNSVAGIYPFTGFGGNDTKSFEGKASAPFIPSLLGAYKTGDWVFSGSISVVGGGGTLTFDKGLPSFEAPISMIPIQLQANSVPTDRYDVDVFMEGSSLILGGQLGATYSINDMFSVYAGFRMNMVSNGYVGHLRDISISPTHPALNPTGELMLASTFFNNAKQAAQGASASLQPAISGGAGEYTLAQMVAVGLMDQSQVDQLAGGLGLSPEAAGALKVIEAQGAFDQAAATYEQSANMTADKNLDCSQSSWGITPMIGFNFTWNRLNVGVKYEFQTSMNLKNKTKVDDTGLFPDGEETPNDLPAILTIGAQYDIIPCVTVSASWNHFFDSDAKMANDKQKYINGGINDYMLGAEWRINKRFLVSAGGIFTRTGVTDDYQADMNFFLNSNSFCFGGAVNVSESVRINLGCLFTNYEDWTKKTDNYNGTGMPGTDVFSRTNKAFGIGVDFRF